jgi:Putative glycosyl/glycerophosphate transferases involved in teichoic acid biosynthesis TagF/TagB/EpsJ/RodC
MDPQNKLQEVKAALQSKILENKRREKLRNKSKPSVVFVCSRPDSWGSLQTVCEAFIEDDRCRVAIVTIPEEEWHGDVRRSAIQLDDSRTYDYLKQIMKCPVIHGYIPDKQRFLDLKFLDPDYLFFQTPYNEHRPAQYSSFDVSIYTRICYLAYGALIFEGHVESVVHPINFLQDVRFHFYESPFFKPVLDALYANSPPALRPKTVLCGSARFDTIEKYLDVESTLWRVNRENSFRIFWSPRWVVHNNKSSFFDYKENFLALSDSEPNIDFVFRPHPLIFSSVIAEGVMSEKDIHSYIRSYSSRSNTSLDRRPFYQDTICSADVIVTDITSLIPEYLATGKPIIFCPTQDGFNAVGAKLSEGFYFATSWSEIEQTLKMLKNNIDPLKDKRREIVKEAYFMPDGGTGAFVKNYLLSDFFKPLK